MRPALYIAVGLAAVLALAYGFKLWRERERRRVVLEALAPAVQRHVVLDLGLRRHSVPIAGMDAASGTVVAGSAGGIQPPGVGQGF